MMFAKKLGPLATIIKGLLDLHTMGEALNDSKEAEDVRCLCDKPWRELDDEQRKLANDLSRLLLVEEAVWKRKGEA